MDTATLTRIRKGETGTVMLGLHAPIVQSVLDFDYLSGKAAPSILAIVTGGRSAQKFFFGKKEITIRCVPSLNAIPNAVVEDVRWMLNVQSGRRAASATEAFFDRFPDALGGVIFAENVPEKHAARLIERFSGKKLVVGPASVGLLVPGHLKLGAIGGIDAAQISSGKLMTPGGVAVGSTSGGMTNELIRAVKDSGHRLSFALSVGGDRFPALSLTELFLMAERDPATKAFAYFGELGGTDEYEIVELIKTKRFTKPVVAYVAGIIDEAFEEHVQFGHAKALVQRQDESARAKREALRACGVVAPDTFPEFLQALRALPHEEFSDTVVETRHLMDRQKSILSTRRVSDAAVGGAKASFSRAALGALLGKPVRSDTTAAFADEIFRLLIDHGGHVSGAVNTMITARAGKDMMSSLAAGILTIGPRFGGAVNGAACAWLSGVASLSRNPRFRETSSTGGAETLLLPTPPLASGVASHTSAAEFVEAWNKRGERIPGIGHRKYRVGLPDPRVAALSKYAKKLKKHPHYDFARAVEKVTTGKGGNLILNIDGVIAALLLDILSECEGLSARELTELANAEFFNAFFVIPRTVGFIAHFLEQKRHDEGLFRLPDELLFEREDEPAKPKKKRKH